VSAIKLASSPEIQPHDGGLWELVLWVGHDNYPVIPFRPFLDDIVELYPEGMASVALPPSKNDEDFVDGTLKIGNAELALYWEQWPISFLSISTANREALEDLRVRLEPIVHVNPQTD
jgi:hypothetical protein